MTGFTLKIDSNIPGIAAAIAASPRLFLAATNRELLNGSRRLATAMKRAVPKFRSELANAIKPVSIAPLEHHVRAEKNYASHVEEGTTGGGVAPISTLENWIIAKGITPHTPGTTPQQLAFLIQKGIQARGSKPQPFAKPSLDKEAPQIEARLRWSLREAIQGMRA